MTLFEDVVGKEAGLAFFAALGIGSAQNPVTFVGVAIVAICERVTRCAGVGRN